MTDDYQLLHTPYQDQSPSFVKIATDCSVYVHKDKNQIINFCLKSQDMVNHSLLEGDSILNWSDKGGN
jgi:hypothetical protein